MIWWLVLGVLPVLPLAVSAINLLTWRRGTLRKKSAFSESLSVLIPARNEAKRIVETIHSVLSSASRGVQLKEILIYDDNSEDDTSAIIEEVFGNEPRVRVIEGEPLPKGWIGKPHACQRLLEEARGEILLFMDADVHLVKGGAARLLSFLYSERPAQVVTAVPRQVVGGFFERLILPLLILTYTSWLPLRLVEVGRRGSTVAANGQLLLMRREVALSLGGFEAVRAEIVDDVAFCRHAKTNGKKVVFADGFLSATCRMYTTSGEVWRGFSKNLFEGVGGRFVNLGAFLLLYLFCFVVPYLAVAIALLNPTEYQYLFGPVLLGVGANLLLRTLLAIRFRQPWEGVILHPLSVLALCAIALNSFRWGVLGTNEWAGRLYPSRTERLRVQAAPLDPSAKLDGRLDA